MGWVGGEIHGEKDKAGETEREKRRTRNDPGTGEAINTPGSVGQSGQSLAGSDGGAGAGTRPCEQGRA